MDLDNTASARKDTMRDAATSDSVDSLAHAWMILAMTGLTLMMGTILAVNMVPNIVLGPFAGVFADRCGQRACNNRLPVSDRFRSALREHGLHYFGAEGRDLVRVVLCVFAWLSAVGCMPGRVARTGVRCF
ncbi:MAG TPA: hypothetical protein DCL63_01940 [Firmicutes bacterium]|nr:hypothetical protein [Bacillota bacterium]